MDDVFFESAAHWRAWLDENHKRATEISVGFYKTSSKQKGIGYKEAVDEALCFGWIDGVRQSIDSERYRIRFTPRKMKSTWSLVNVRRVGELTTEGRMRESGLKAFEARDSARSGIYSFENPPQELDASQEAQFKGSPEAWAYFQSQAASYRRAALWWVASAKQEATRVKRLATLIEDSAHGRRIAILRYK